MEEIDCGGVCLCGAAVSLVRLRTARVTQLPNDLQNTQTLHTLAAPGIHYYEEQAKARALCLGKEGGTVKVKGEGAGGGGGWWSVSNLL